MTLPPSKESESLVDCHYFCHWAVDDKGTVKSPASVAPPPQKKKKKKKAKKDKSSSSKASKPSQNKPSADAKIAELDQKWSDRFNRLEALLMASTFEPTFSSTVKVTPTHLHLQLRMCLSLLSDRLPLQSLLDLASLLQSISRPVKQ